jgi:hypothetical protein
MTARFSEDSSDTYEMRCSPLPRHVPGTGRQLPRAHASPTSCQLATESPICSEPREHRAADPALAPPVSDNCDDLHMCG